MEFKVIIFVVFVAKSQAGILAPLAHTVVDTKFDSIPQYTFGYDVQDPFTGDNKNQIESRSGDVVQGSYSLNDPDGTRRTVDYTADPINGFNAIVKKTPILQTVPLVTKIASVVPKSEPHGHDENAHSDINKSAYKIPLTYSLFPVGSNIYPFVYTHPYLTHYY